MSHRQRRDDRLADASAVGSRHTVEITALDGPAALAYTAEGRRVRIPGGVPGDVADIEIVAKGKRELWARLVDVKEASQNRVDPPCPVVRECGACPWQAVRYREQLVLKGEMVRSAITSRPLLAGARIHDPVGIAPPLHYRTKVQMPVGGRSGALTLGFYAPRSHQLVPVDQCIVQHPAAERVRQAVLATLNPHDIAPYDESSKTGDLRYVLIRVAEGTGEVGVVLVTRSLEAFDWAILASELEAIEELTGVWVNENDTPGNAVLGPRTVHLAGKRRLQDRLMGRTFQRNPLAFFQTNHRATEKLLQTVRALIDEPVDSLFDLYAGGGLFAVTLSDMARQLTLVESHPDAVAAARATLRDCDVNHANIHLGRVEKVLPQLTEDGIAADVIIIDPPRAGIAREAIDPIAATGSERVIYVSCHLRSLVRDLEALVERGFQLAEIHGVDMFPHTPHLETVSLLTR